MSSFRELVDGKRRWIPVTAVLIAASFLLIAANGSLTGFFIDQVENETDTNAGQQETGDTQQDVSQPGAATGEMNRVKVEWMANDNPGPSGPGETSAVDYVVYRVAQPSDCSGQSSCDPVADVTWEMDDPYITFTNGEDRSGEPICSEGQCGFVDEDQYEADSGSGGIVGEAKDTVERETEQLVEDVEGLLGNTWYCYRITAANDKGVENPGGTLTSFQTGVNQQCVATLPNPPIPESASVVTASNGEPVVSASWDRNGNGEGTTYELTLEAYRSTRETVAGQQIGTQTDAVKVDERKVTLSSDDVSIDGDTVSAELQLEANGGVLLPNHHYNIEISALNVQGESSSSDDVLEIWSPATIPVITPEDVNDASSARMDVAWQPNENPNWTLYEVYKTYFDESSETCTSEYIPPVDPDSDCTEQVDGENACIYRGTATAINDYEVDPEGDYCYRIAAIHEESEDAPSEQETEVVRTDWHDTIHGHIDRRSWLLGGEESDWEQGKTETDVQILAREGVEIVNKSEGPVLQLRGAGGETYVAQGRVEVLFNGGVPRVWKNHGYCTRFKNGECTQETPSGTDINFTFKTCSPQNLRDTGCLGDASNTPEDAGKGTYIMQIIEFSSNGLDTPTLYNTSVEHCVADRPGCTID